MRGAHAGEALLDPSSRRARGDARRGRGRGAARPADPARERVLVLIAHGYANKRIAQELALSEKTVKAHVSHVLAKLGVGDRTQAAVFAVRAGLVGAGS